MRCAFYTALLCLLPISGWAAVTTEEVLSRMDAASSSFQSATANIKRVTHTAVLNDNAQESGSFSVLRTKGRDVRMLIEFTQPDPKSVAFQDRKAQIFYPKLNQVEIYDLGKYGKLVDQFLLLGFGTPGRDLAKSYSIKLLGEETLAGKKAVKLELTPKSQDAREQLTKVELWLPENAEFPLQQKFYQPSGDYIFITYSDVKLNAPLTQEALALKMPKNVKKVTPQK
jgi:outer membrane lipoprotein-sorting protein